MPRFFVNTEDICDGALEIKGEDAFHIARALRMAVGDEISVADTDGRVHTCRLTKIRDEACSCDIINTEESKSESPVDIKLYMAYPKSDKLELIIQKAVELGVGAIIPFISSRCIKKPVAEKEERQTARLSRIAEEAAKQCGRSVLPKVSRPKDFITAVKEASISEVALICYENESRLSIKDALPKSAPKSLSVVIGAEGGFSPEEAETAISLGLRSVSLGNRILRCETAPSFVLSVISYLYEL